MGCSGRTMSACKLRNWNEQGAVLRLDDNDIRLGTKCDFTYTTP